jgi:hypothetical protein
VVRTHEGEVERDEHRSWFVWACKLKRWTRVQKYAFYVIEHQDIGKRVRQQTLPNFHSPVEVYEFPKTSFLFSGNIDLLAFQALIV